MPRDVLGSFGIGDLQEREDLFVLLLGLVCIGTYSFIMRFKACIDRALSTSRTPFSYSGSYGLGFRYSLSNGFTF